ncbi:MAG: hypothetical protein IMF19_15315 [Proteobacteria bacterium]|nr:hypothetical protein [Pseudomonadota bacterium]
MIEIVEIFKIIGVFLGVIAFFWKIFDLFGSYLRINLEVKQEGTGSSRSVSALTTVDNKGFLSKRIDYAGLLIGPEDEDPVITAKHIAKELNIDENKIAYTNDLYILRTDSPSPIYTGRRAFIPLPFFFDEQVNIGDETLRYHCTIDTVRLIKNTSYSVRFFIFTKHRLHRSTHDLFRNDL